MAKVQRRGLQKEHETPSTHLIQLSGPHAIESFINMKARCGATTFQWRYGVEADVECQGCKDAKG